MERSGSLGSSAPRATRMGRVHDSRRWDGTWFKIGGGRPEPWMKGQKAEGAPGERQRLAWGGTANLLGLWREGPPPKSLDERVRQLEGQVTPAREALSSVKELAEASRLMAVRTRELQGHFHFDDPCSGKCSQQIAKFWQAHSALQTAIAHYDEVRKKGGL